MNILSNLRELPSIFLAICIIFLIPISVFSQSVDQTPSEINIQQTEVDTISEENIVTESEILPSRVDIWKTAIRPDYFAIDKYVKECGGNCGKTPQEVAEKVTSICKSDIEKARAIFDWIAYNIAYDTTYSTYGAEAAFKKRKSICNGYADLFQVMGKHVGLNTIFVSGDAKNNLNYKPSGSLTFGRGGGHAWNIVVLPDREILIDATWGAGGVSGNRFIRSFDSYWFDVHPAEAIFTHFPKEPSYQLLEPCISYALFKELPYLVPIFGYSGIYPPEILKFFLEHPEKNFIEYYGTLETVILAGLKFEKIPLTRYLKSGKEYEIRYHPINNITLTIENSKYEKIGRKVENQDGSISLFFSEQKGKSLNIFSSITDRYIVNQYTFVDKEVPFSKRKPLYVAMPRAVRIPKEIHFGSEFVQTGNKLIDGYFIKNTEIFVKDVQSFLDTAKKYFFHPEQATLLQKQIAKQTNYSPVTGFTVEQCAAFCNYMSDKEGFSHCYSYDEEGNIILDKAVNGYRIASLDEWIFAATNGTMQVPQNKESLAECSWFMWNSAGYVHEIGRGKANSFGLHDMFGNVREIVFDEESGEYCAIGGSASDDYDEVVSLKTYKADKNGIINGTLRLVRFVDDDAEAITQQAENFLYGNYVYKNEKKAFEWFTLGLEKGSTLAANGLGKMYSEGIYVEQNYNTAFDYFLIAANMGNAIANYNIAIYYDEGYIGEANHAEAAVWYKKAADYGYAKAMLKVSQNYKEGIGFPQDLVKSFEYLKMSIDNNISDNNTITDIASCYELGIGTEINLSEAYKYFKQAAYMGSVLGMNKAADFCFEGKGMSRPDYYDAAVWYNKAAEKGNLYAIVQLSKMYYYGFNYSRNIDKAVEKAKYAIDAGYKLEDEYYEKLLLVKQQLDLYGTNKDIILRKIPRETDVLEYLKPYISIDTISEKLSGSKIANPFIFNNLTNKELQTKVISFMQMASESKEFPSGTKVLLLVLPEDWQKSHPLAKLACSENVFAINQRRMNGERYKFDQSLFAYYDAIIPIKVKAIDAYIKSLAPVIKGCKRTDMLLLGEILFDKLLRKKPETQNYQTCLHDIWEAQINLGVRPRIIALGDKTDKIQKNINLLFEPDGEHFAEKINVFGMPMDMTNEIALGFRKGNLLICLLTKTFASKKAFQIYLDETGAKQGSIANSSTFIPDSKFLTSMKNGANKKIDCISKPGKMVMDYAVVKPY